MVRSVWRWCWRWRWKMPAALCAMLAAGCAGYLRPIAVCDGRTLILLMAGDTLGEPDPETRVLLPAEGGAWRQIEVMSGTARSAALWGDRLWAVYHDNCSTYRLDGGRLTRENVQAFARGHTPVALAVHREALWALTVAGQQMQAWRLDGDAAERDAWQPVGRELELGTAAPGSVRAAGSIDGLWVLWRKRDAAGGSGAELYSARLLPDASWRPGPARNMPQAELAVCTDPAGPGITVAVSSPAADRLGRELAVLRLCADGWSEPRVLDVPAREFGSAAIGLGLCPAPGGEKLLLFVGRQDGLGVYRLDRDSVRPWPPGEIVRLDLRGLETLLTPMLLLAGLLVGAGLGTAAVRRTRLFPLLPGQPAPAPLPVRAAAWLVDNLLVSLLFYPALLATGLPFHVILRSEWLSLTILIAGRVLFIFYSAVFEARWAATPGKRFFGLRVADADGRRPTTRSAIMRNLLRLFDEALAFPLPGMVMVLVSRRAQRLGDVFAGTVVTTARSLGELSDDRRRKSDRFGLP
jgi:uncharacterized RDD family membrane protein YckC